jgi:hypothetical protein
VTPSRVSEHPTTARTSDGAAKQRRAQRNVDAITASAWFMRMKAAVERDQAASDAPENSEQVSAPERPPVFVKPGA